jgi:hypothetical protein
LVAGFLAFEEASVAFFAAEAFLSAADFPEDSPVALVADVADGGFVAWAA